MGGMAAAPYAQDLADLLHDDAVSLRWTLVDGLRNLGHAGAEALSSLLNDRNPLVRETASTTLQQMGWSSSGEALSTAACSAASPRSFRYAFQTEAGSTPSHVQMRIRGPDALLGQSASPRLYRRPAR